MLRGDVGRTGVGRVDAEFGRSEIRAVLELDADRSLRFGAPLFGVLHAIEALSHLGDGASAALIVPTVSTALLFALTAYQRKRHVPIPHVEYWILAPWAISIVSILLHVPENAQVAIAFVTLALMSAATLLLPMVSFAIALPFSVAAQFYCLIGLPGVLSPGLFMVPLFSTAIAILTFRSRRQSLISAERARFFERELHKKQEQLALVEFERQNAELEDALYLRSEELKESRRSLQEHERLAAVGTVAAGVAHQVNNPVGVILAAADFALEMSGQDDAHKVQADALRKIREQAIRCGKIVKSLLKLSRGAAKTRESHEFVACVEAAIGQMVDPVAELGGAIELRVQPGLTGARVSVSGTELGEVFVNLIQNALEAKSSGVRILIELSAREHGVEACVRDNGPGITAEDRPHLFEPFYTNRLRSGGTGLGLSVADRIITDFGGRIWVDPERRGDFAASEDAAKDADSADDAGHADHADYAGAAFHVWLPLEKQES
ncbi:MAG: sensor histidine kinase [Myxococcota bacterium]